MDEKSKSGNEHSNGVMQITPGTAESAASPSADGYLLQVQSYADELSAIQSVARLKQMGHQAHIEESELDGKIWYRVQIGGFRDHASALTAQDALSEAGMTNTLLIKNDQ
jgi:general secretion pathway protein D